ncbi:MAG: mechanosensitive ion channel family protein [Heteroscytonema crispum UTEX LB 1556]
MRSQFLAYAGSIAISVLTVPNATAQIPFLPNFQSPTGLSNDSESRVVTEWVYLDGRRLFQVAAQRANLSERVENIQHKLDEISQNYFESTAKDVNVQIKTLNGLPVIYVNNQYLMTITSQDARLRQVDAFTSANQISQVLQESLQRGKQERQTKFLVRQGQIAGATGLTIMIISWGIYYTSRYSRRHSSVQLVNSPLPAVATAPITTQLKQQQQRNLKEVKRRLFQLAQVAIWGGGTFFILGLFPYTRSLQLGILRALQIPLRLGVVGLLTYVAIRFSYALIDRFTSAFVSSSALLAPENEIYERLRLRVSTISGVCKSIVTLVWVGVGILLALMSLGVDIVPLLAGAGLVGVAVSLASQNLIKDAINGFLIILEDQYALGDVIAVGNSQGFVENLNLRITQLRDAEGRLITIPNSEIKTVANLSSRWSRADLNIPVGYQADVDQALKLIENVALEMDRDSQWQEQIVETPRVLGVDKFGDRGLIIRVWIKTQPLKQWDVAREFRRRLKIAFDQAGVSIPIPQQAISLNDAQLFKSLLDDKVN